MLDLFRLNSLGRVVMICSSSTAVLNSLIKIQPNRKMMGSCFWPTTGSYQLPASSFLFFCLVGCLCFARGSAYVSERLAAVIWRQPRRILSCRNRVPWSIVTVVSPSPSCFAIAGIDCGLDFLAAQRSENMALGLARDTVRNSAGGGCEVHKTQN